MQANVHFCDLLLNESLVLHAMLCRNLTDRNWSFNIKKNERTKALYSLKNGKDIKIGGLASSVLSFGTLVFF